MRVLYYMPFPGSLGADRWIFEGWKFAFQDTGHHFLTFSEADDWADAIDGARPDVLFVANLVELSEQRDRMLRARDRGIVVFLIVHWPLREGDLRVIRDADVADVYFGEREPESMIDFERLTGRAYQLIPNAANRKWHFPSGRVARYAYDVAYLGAFLPKKTQAFTRLLFPLRSRYRCGIFGPYWTLTDNALRAAQAATRKLGLKRIAGRLNALRLAIPPEEERLLYSSSKICINFHERERDGSQPHYIVNQRAFKIPACGGFQLCDFVPALRKYFDEDEVVMARDQEDWFRKIDHFLTADRERDTVARKGAARALRDHTYHNRVDLVSRLYSQVKDGGR